MRPYLTTPRLTLRPFADTDADLDLVVDLDSDPEVMRYLTGGRPMTRTEIRADSFARMLRTYPVGGFWATHLRDTGEFIGWHCLRRFGDAPPRSADLGYRLRKSAWGRGYATEGSFALIEKGFTELGLDRITANTMYVNAPSRKVMERCGLSYTRTYFEEWAEPVEGAEHGEVEYVLTKDEWAGTPGPRRVVGRPTDHPNHADHADHADRLERLNHPDHSDHSDRWDHADRWGHSNHPDHPNHPGTGG
ncbi:GNAT family N-acetyltransferase [Streptomyces sp. SID1034]|uniref:GNAT family N-acetyltransferase n=1 Tax=Streptomyces sp. SID1034 TaxID=2690248 RepID=UPI00136E06A2|nr:GNAT family N-acetyltransferase [Streptomyces sp. SID1034]